MIKYVYCSYDRVAGFYGNLQMVNLMPEDYKRDLARGLAHAEFNAQLMDTDIFYVGSYDDEAGKFVELAYSFLCHISDFRKVKDDGEK